jgi:hypothetical protein
MKIPLGDTLWEMSFWSLALISPVLLSPWCISRACSFSRSALLRRLPFSAECQRPLLGDNTSCVEGVNSPGRELRREGTQLRTLQVLLQLSAQLWSQRIEERPTVSPTEPRALKTKAPNTAKIEWREPQPSQNCSSGGRCWSTRRWLSKGSLLKWSRLNASDFAGIFTRVVEREIAGLPFLFVASGTRVSW